MGMLSRQGNAGRNHRTDGVMISGGNVAQRRLSNSETKPRRLDRRYAAVVAGFTLAYAVCVSFFYSSWLLDRPDFSVLPFDNALNASVFATSLALSMFVATKPTVRRSPCLVVGFAAFALAIGGMFSSAVGTSDQNVALASSVAAGVGMGLVMPFYFEALAPYSPRMAAIGCGFMSLGGMAANLLVGLLPKEIEFALYALCLAGSAACMIAASRFDRTEHCSEGGSEETRRGKTAEAVHHGGSDAEDGHAHRAHGPLSKRDFLDVFLVSGVCTFALSIVYGIVDTAATGGSSSPAASVIISQFGGIVAAAVFLAYFGTRSNPSPSLLFNVVFGILATGILFLPFLSSGYTVSLNILAAAGWKLVMLSLFYLVVVTYARDRKKLLVGISLAYALPRFGLFIGQNVAQLLGMGSSADFVRTTAVAFFLLYLILMVIWMVNSHERKKAETQARAADEMLGRFAQEQENVLKLRCGALADDAGLTNREKDILFLLAQGRDVAFICDSLYLSKNTVKSYQKSIYAKLDVHSKQEIIDLVQRDGQIAE